jgi:hypothetical protein
MLTTSGRSICLIGNAVYKHGKDALKSIFIQGGKIEDVLSGRIDVDTGQWEILSLAGLIFPGFINLHTSTIIYSLCGSVRFSEPNLKRAKLLYADDEFYHKRIAQALQMASVRTF